MSTVDVEQKWHVFRDEILRLMYLYDAMASGMVLTETEGVKKLAIPEEDLLRIRRQLNTAIADACSRHKREWAMMAGEKVEPVTHFGDATLVRVVEK